MGKVSEIQEAVRRDPEFFVYYNEPRGAEFDKHLGWVATRRSSDGGSYGRGLPYLGVVKNELRRLGIYCECTLETYHQTRRSRARGRGHGGIPRRARGVLTTSETDGGA